MFQNCDVLNVNSNKDIELLNKNYDTISALNVNGSISCNKGIRIGESESEVPGLIIFDGANFLGFNKNGWNLLSENKYFELIDNKNIIYEENILNLIANIDDNTNLKFILNQSNYKIKNIKLFLNKIYDTKINEINILLINNTNEEYKFDLISNNYSQIFYNNKKNILKECLILNILIDDNNYFVSFKEFKK